MITVITPFSRVENKDYLIKVLEGKCNWIILQAEGEAVIEFPEWVKVQRFPVAGQDNLSNRLLNAFFGTKLDSETQYMVLCDDDSVEEGFFEKIPDEDAILVSMLRSDRPVKHVVWSDWDNQMGYWDFGLDVLEAKSENLRLGGVGGEQLILKGKHLKNFRYGLSNVGDGDMILKVSQEIPITYIHNAFVLFNYFEDGRYQAFRREKGRRNKPVVLFIGDYFCAGRPAMGLSEWEGNIWASLESTEKYEVCRFHFDKYYYHTGTRGDEALLDRINTIQPDYIVLIIYKEPGSDPAVLTIDTLAKIKVPIVTIWGDLEAEYQRSLAKRIEPFCWRMFGTANKSVVEGMGYKYMHVPKDPRIFNNPSKERDIDVVFSGSFGLGREERQEALQYLLDNGIKLVVGGSEGRDHFTTEEYADRYRRAKIALSFSRAHGMDVINARPFEAMLCGAMVLNQQSDEMKKLYEEGKEFVEWTTKEDLLDKVRYYLSNEIEMYQIASNGCLRTRKDYSAKAFWDEVFK